LDLSSYSGNIIPSANVVYSLGTPTHQWKDLFVSNTVYLSGLPLTISNGNLLVNGNLVTGTGGGNVANLWNSGKTVSLGTNGITTFPGDIYFNNNSGVIEQGANRLTITGNAIQVNTGAYFNDDGEAAIFANTSVQIATNSNSVNPPLWDFSSTGNLTFPTGASIVNGYPGPAGSAGDGQSWFVTSTNSGGVASPDGKQYVQVDNGGLVIGTNYTASSGNEWVFSQTGIMSLPYSNYIQTINTNMTVGTQGGLTIISNAAGGATNYNWTFGQNGRLTFPDTTVQTTAYSNSAVTTYLASTATQSFGGAVTVVGNLTVQGNIILNGNATLVATNNLIINDNIIYIANANPGSSLDIGFAGHFTSTTYQHTGLVRQASTNTWKLFSNVTAEPGNTIDFTYAKYDDLQVGNITSPTIDTLTANAGAQAGSLATITANLGAVAGSLTTLTANAASQAGSLATITANLGAVSGSLATLTANAASQAGDIATLYANAGAQAGSLSTITANLGSVAGSLATLTANAGAQAGILAGLTSYANTNVAAYLTTATISTTGNITAGNLVTSGAFYVANITTTGSSGNISGANYITANYFIGNGSQLTGVAIKTTGSWTVPTGNSTQSFTVPASGTYQLWVDCNIPNGILAWNATATVTNTNVPVVGAQYAWVYTGGGTPVDFTSIPNQFTGTGNTIVRSSTAPSATTNRFDFGINNTSGGNITVRYGYVSIS
jgi:hypothetical protein